MSKVTNLSESRIRIRRDSSANLFESESERIRISTNPNIRVRYIPSVIYRRNRSHLWISVRWGGRWMKIIDGWGYRHSFEWSSHRKWCSAIIVFGRFHPGWNDRFSSWGEHRSDRTQTSRTTDQSMDFIIEKLIREMPRRITMGWAATINNHRSSRLMRIRIFFRYR